MTRWAGAVLALVGICLLPGACSSNGGGAPTARFKLSGDTPPNVMDVPFPTDAYRSSGKIIDPIPGFDALFPRNGDLVTRELAKLDGFGRAMFSFFYVDDPSTLDSDGNPVAADIDPASLPVDEDECVKDTSSVFLIDLAPADPSKARIRCRGAIDDETQTSATARPMVAVGPGLGIVLEEGHSYAAVLTSRVRDKSGARVAASADFQALLSGKRTGTLGTLYGNAIDAVQAALGGALASDQSSIVAIAPFTTHTMTREMFKLRETLEGLPVPALAWDATSMAPMGAVKFAAPVNSALPAGFTASLDAWLGVAPQVNGGDDPDYLTTHVVPHDHIGAIGTAVYQSASFLLDGQGFSDPTYHTFARDSSGNIVPNPSKPTMPVWVSFAIPKTAMPANGYPCVILHHGLPGSRAELFMMLANTLTAKGFVVAAYDMFTNGARALDPKYQVDVHTDWEASPGATYKGPDGISDNLDSSGQPSVSGTRAGNLDLLAQGQNFGAARDQLRQAEIDISELVRVLASNPDLSPLQTGATVPKIDPTKIGYYGGSMGALLGSVAAAIEPKVTLWVLNVGGGQLFAHTAHAPVTQAAIQGAMLLAFGITGQYANETNLLTTLLEDAIDPWEPLNYASYLVKSPGSILGTPNAPRNVLQIEVLYDDEVGNDGSEAFARAAGWGLAVPNVGPNSHIDTMDLVRDPTKVLDPMPLPNVSPDGSGLIHDTPVAGITSVLVQVTGQHYRNMTQSSDMRAYPVPFNASTKPLAAPYSVGQSYVQQQAMIARYFDDGFQSNVPNVAGIPTPVRDVDEDGTPDATDPDPNDPTIK